MDSLELEIKTLKSSLLEMWFLVINQLEDARLALFSGDSILAGEVHTRESLLDSFDIRHDKTCEQIISQFHPVEENLRLILASLKINYNLERIGDYANYMGNTVRRSGISFDPELLKKIRLAEMFEITHIMLVQSYESFNAGDARPVKKFPVPDKKLDDLKRSSQVTLGDHIGSHPGEAAMVLELFAIISKLERVGDHCRNIAEEIIFYLEDRVVKHKKVNK
jgi:phosphate transport system protein